MLRHQNRHSYPPVSAVISNTQITSKHNNYIATTNIKVPIEYIFIDKNNQLRSKSRTLDFMPMTLVDIPPLYLYLDDEQKKINSDLYTNKQQYTPVAMYSDPFRTSYKGKLVLCESPTRQQCKDIMDHYTSLEPWFGMEQEYVLFDPKTNKPLGWPLHGEPESHVCK
jgi:glutamine synthetase